MFDVFIIGISIHNYEYILICMIMIEIEESS